jgi:hypothetical protein
VVPVDPTVALPAGGIEVTGGGVAVPVVAVPAPTVPGVAATPAVPAPTVEAAPGVTLDSMNG